MKNTTNYSLLLPEENDFYSVHDMNANTEIIDTQLKNNQNATDNHTANKSNPHGVTKAQVGLSNVPNVATNDQTPTYSDTTTLATLVSGEKLNVAFQKIKYAISSLISHLGNTSNPHAVTKSQVGLGNCDNTSDVNKPVSTAQQTALNLKVDKVTGMGLSTNDYTSAEKTKLAGIVAGAQVNSITGIKGNAESTYRTGQVNITPANIGLGNVNNTADSSKSVASAAKLTAAKTITLTGDVTGSVSFDGSSDVNISALLNTVPISKGGTNATTKEVANNNLTVFDTNKAPSNDIPNSYPIGVFLYRENTSSLLPYKPTTFGIMLSLKIYEDIGQLWFGDNKLYFRSGNATGWNGSSTMPTNRGWKQIQTI